MLILSSKLAIIIGLGIIVIDSGILSKGKLKKVKNIISILFQSKKETESYSNFPIPEELPFEIRITPNSKKIINVPNWIKAAIPVFKYGQKNFKKKHKKKPNDQSDQSDQNIINELKNLSTETDDIDYIDKENFILNFEDLIDLKEEFFE